MRYRTAAILSFVLVAGMYGFVYAMGATANRYAEQTLEIPFYLRVLFVIADYFGRFKWLLAPWTVMALFIIAAFTKEFRTQK